MPCPSQDEAKVTEALLAREAALRLRRGDLERRIKELGTLPANAYDDALRGKSPKQLQRALKQANERLKQCGCALAALCCAVLCCSVCFVWGGGHARACDGELDSCHSYKRPLMRTVGPRQSAPQQMRLSLPHHRLMPSTLDTELPGPCGHFIQQWATLQQVACEN